MAINPDYLAKAVVHWTEFEGNCLRGSLFSEAYLSQPIGQVLNARSKNPIEPEVPHPVLKGLSKHGRVPAIDFVVRTRNKSIITDAIETKWVTDKRDFKQEVFDDLVRLETVHTDNRQIGRWLLLAGKYHHLRDGIFDAEGNTGAGSRAPVFAGVLSESVGDRLVVPIRGATLPASRFWKNAGKEFKILLPTSLTTTLRAVFPADPGNEDIACFVWHVGRVSRRSEFSF